MKKYKRNNAVEVNAEKPTGIQICDEEFCAKQQAVSIDEQDDDCTVEPLKTVKNTSKEEENITTKKIISAEECKNSAFDKYIEHHNNLAELLRIQNRNKNLSETEKNNLEQKIEDARQQLNTAELILEDCKKNSR